MVKLNRIYTRTGDKGTTGLVDGSRVPKHNLRLAAMGDIDEANSAIGAAVAILNSGSSDAAALQTIQNDLFDLGADLATPGEDFTPSPVTLRIVASQVERLEHEIDAMNESLTALDSFILPGGSPAAAAIHMARAIVRRAERSATLAAEAIPLNPLALSYINRLSDYLFVLARRMNGNGAADIKWIPGAAR